MPIVSDVPTWVSIVERVGFPMFISIALLFILYKLLIPMREDVAEMRALIAAFIEDRVNGGGKRGRA